MENLDRKTMHLRARKLQKNSTQAEHHLWYLLRSRHFYGFKFKRQHAEALEYDTKRTAFLESKGYIVMRFWNNLVFTETEGVLTLIFNQLLSSNQDFPAVAKLC